MASQILVVAELHEGKIRKSTHSAITFAKNAGLPFAILVAGDTAKAAAAEVTAFGATKVIAADLNGYVNRAIALANAPETPGQLADLRRSIRLCRRALKASAKSSPVRGPLLHDLAEGLFRDPTRMRERGDDADGHLPTLQPHGEVDFLRRTEQRGPADVAHVLTDRIDL